MGTQRVIGYILAGLIAFIFSSGFLGFCMGPSYTPCTIEFIDPVDGTVLPAGTEQVTIHGRIIAGDKQPSLLKADNQIVPFDAATGEFTYELALNPQPIYDICTFEVFDQNFIANRQKIALAVGDSSDPAGEGVVDNALGVLLTDAFMDELEEIIPIILDPMIDDLLTDQLPMVVEISDLLGDLVIEDIQIGSIAVAIDILEGDEIAASITITPPPEGGKALVVDGYHAGLLWDTPVGFSADKLEVNDVRLRLRVDEASGDILAILDLGSADIDLTNPIVSYGALDIPSWLTTLLIDIVDDFLGDLLGDLELPVLNINDLTTELEGIQVAAWLMNTETIFTSTESTMSIDLGLNARTLDPIFPALTCFYSTPGDVLPVLAPSGEENLMVAINDDMINEVAFALVQVGFIQNLDVSSAIADSLGELGSGLKAYVTLSTPPVADFSGQPLPTDSFADIITDFGRFVIPNLVIEIKTPLLFGWTYSARISVDVNAALKLKLSDDGRRIQAQMDASQTNTSITVLYDNTTNAALLPEIGRDVANVVVGLVIESLIDIKIPLTDLEGAELGIALMGTELVGNENTLVAKLLIENATSE